MQDIKKYVPFAITVVGFLFGVSLILDVFNQVTPMWMLPIGILIVVVTYPLGYYHFSKLKNGYHGSRQAEALEQAEKEAGIKERSDAKK